MEQAGKSLDELLNLLARSSLSRSLLSISEITVVAPKSSWGWLRVEIRALRHSEHAHLAWQQQDQELLLEENLVEGQHYQEHQQSQLASDGQQQVLEGEPQQWSAQQLQLAFLESKGLFQTCQGHNGDRPTWLDLHTLLLCLIQPRHH